MCKIKRHKQRGFSIPEILITLGIVSIVLSTAVPAISTTIRDSRLSTHLNNVVADIHFARSEAAKRDVRVIMCRSAYPNAKVPKCGGTEKVWTTGYIIFADDGNYTNNVYNDGVDTLLRRGQEVESGVKLRTNWTWNRNLEFNPSGSTNEGGVAEMSICDSRGDEYGKQIVVAQSGLPKMYSNNIRTCFP
ncbi:MAG: GspH/FimT family protein [Gammaproteobacteria bacterium]|nr:MAG: GspH/FimT family protein [Gammaproteobacteria bacterium]